MNSARRILPQGFVARNLAGRIAFQSSAGMNFSCKIRPRETKRAKTARRQSLRRELYHMPVRVATICCRGRNYSFEKL